VIAWENYWSRYLMSTVERAGLALRNLLFPVVVPGSSCGYVPRMVPDPFWAERHHRTWC
jgi:hypothetical protein